MSSLKVNRNLHHDDLPHLVREVRKMMTPLGGQVTVPAESALARSSTLAAAGDLANVRAVLAWVIDRMVEKGLA